MKYAIISDGRIVMNRLTVYPCKQNVYVVVLKGQPATKHYIEDNTTAPYVYLWAGIPQATNNLWCGIIRAPTAGLQEFAVGDNIRQAKVSDLHIELIVQQNVLWFQVSMYDLEFVAVVDA